MKSIFFAVLLVVGMCKANAQDEPSEEQEIRKGFKKENLFTGGSIVASFSNYTTVVGASPIFGYTINKWLDAGIVFNFTYSSNRHVTYYNPSTGTYYISDDKLRQTIFGPGAFVKFYPVKFLFVQVQGEQNFMSQKLIFDNGAPTEKDKLSAASLLLGAGYCNGREGPGNLFYYVSIMFDVAKNRNSPYVEQLSSGRVNVLPIIRAGLQVPLFQGKRNNNF